MDVVNVGYYWNYIEPYFVFHHAEEKIDHLLYLFHTPAVLETDGERHPVDTGNAVLIPQGKPHNLTSNSRLLTLDWISFTADSADLFMLDSIGCYFNEIIVLQDPDAISSMIMNCGKMMQKHSKLDRTARSHQLRAILYYMTSMKNDSGECNIRRGKHPEILELRRRIYEMPQADWTLESIAHEMHLSVSSLQKLYKSILGTTCITDVISARLSSAKHQLITTKLPISEIAFKSGFRDYAYFSRTFKRIVGKSPLEFRKEYDVSNPANPKSL